MKTALLYNPEIQKYNFGQGHPFDGERFKRFFDFLKRELADFEDYFQLINPPAAEEKDLELFHSKDYIKVITAASKETISEEIFQYITPDNTDPQTGYLPKGIEKAARISVGSSIKAAELVFERKFQKAVSLGGGLHHAKARRGEGFCFYNDVVIAAKKLLSQGAKKILILDTDVHAGNGTAEAFYEDGRVLLIDLHQNPRTIYPGTGFLEEIGSKKGEGLIVNVPLAIGAGDNAYQYVFREIIFPLAEEFKPELIIRYGGSDAYFNDGLANLGLTLDGFKMIGENVKRLSKLFCGGREVDLLASGYNREILPLAWTSLLAGLLDLPVSITDPQGKLAPSKDAKLTETKETVKKLKEILKKYWRCFR
ncbi:MAG: hypothetical protein V1841_00310 [Patescibacteria group bacterium]